MAGLLACGGAEPEAGPLPSASAVDRDNQAPRIVSVVLDPAAPAPGSSVRAVVNVEDPDGDPVKMTYAWTLDGEPVGGARPKLALPGGSRDQRLEVTVVASDGRADSDPATAWAHLANRPPRVERLLMGPALEITAGTEVEVEAVVDDADGDDLELRYAWTVNGVPTDQQGPSFDTRALHKGDELVVEVSARDRVEASDPLVSPAVTVVNLPPRVVSGPGPSSPGEGFRYRVQAEDPDGDALRFELDEAPPGMRIDPIDGEITWQPERDQAGTHTVRVVIDDRNGGRIASAFDVQVGSAVASVSGVTDEP